MDQFKDKMSHKAFFSSSFHFASIAGPVESCPSSPLFIPAKPEKESARRTRKHIKEGGGGSTDSEDPAMAGFKETSKRKRRKGQTNQRGGKGKTAGSKREEGPDSKGSEVARRSTVMEKREDKSSPARGEQRSTGNVKALEQLRLNKTEKVLGERRFIPFRADRKIEGDKMLFDSGCRWPSIHPHVVFPLDILKNKSVSFSKIHCRMRKLWLSRTERNRRPRDQMGKAETGKDWRTSTKNVWKWALRWSRAQTNTTGSRGAVSKENRSTVGTYWNPPGVL